MKPSIRIFLLVMVAFAVVFGAAQAALAAPSLSGTVFDGATGSTTPLPGIIVYLYRMSGSTVTSSTSQRTGPTGQFTFTNVAVGDYVVRFYDQSGARPSQYYNCVGSISTAQVLTVTESDQSGIDAYMEQGGGVQGTVRNTANVPVQGIQCYVFRTAIGGGLTQVASCLSRADGTYAFAGLVAGNYKVRFHDASGAYPDQWNDGAVSGETAIPFAVGGGGVVTKDAYLSSGGLIGGAVTSMSGGTALQGISVYLFEKQGADYVQIKSMSTGADGRYVFQALSVGDYKIRFYDQTAVYVGEFYSDKTTLAAAQALTLSAQGSLPNVNAQLSPSATISGTVTGEGGALLQYIRVRLYKKFGTDWIYADGRQTDASGRYELTRVAPGDYLIRFSESTLYYAVRYNNAAISTDTAPAMSIAEGQHLTGIDAAMVVSGKVGGTVTYLGAPLAGIRVTLYPRNHEAATAWAVTGAAGTYLIDRIPDGEYRAEFSDPTNNAYITQYYNNATALSSATRFQVLQGTVTTPIGAAMAPHTRISGVVTAASGGTPVSGAYVATYKIVGSTLVEGPGMTVGADGAFAFDNLAAASYKLKFYHPLGSYLDQWYSNKATDSLADTITVVPGTDFVGNCALVTASIVSGTVRSGGAGVGNVRVYIYNVDGGGFVSAGNVLSAANGTYSLTKLAAAQYKVRFLDSAGTYAEQYYNIKVDATTANAIAVPAASTVAGIDASLTVSCSISGKVTAHEGGANLANIRAYAYRYNGTTYASWSSVLTDASGNYTLGRLPTGSYKIRFVDSTGKYIDRYYNEVATLAAATVVPLSTSGAAATGINARMELK